MPIPSEPYEPRTHQRFWCSHCDATMVDSQHPETGNFYLAFGHRYDDNTKEYDGEYLGVMFAICRECGKR